MITVQQTILSLTVSQDNSPDVTVQQLDSVTVDVAQTGLQGPPGPPASPGPGFQVVGNEIRHDFASLPRV